MHITLHIHSVCNGFALCVTYTRCHCRCRRHQFEYIIHFSAALFRASFLLLFVNFGNVFGVPFYFVRLSMERKHNGYPFSWFTFSLVFTWKHYVCYTNENQRQKRIKHQQCVHFNLFSDDFLFSLFLHAVIVFIRWSFSFSICRASYY